jgi:hypothetical protein
MPRWIKEPAALGVQTFVMDSSRASPIDDASHREELEQQLRQVQHDLDVLHGAALPAAGSTSTSTSGSGSTVPDVQ